MDQYRRSGESVSEPSPVYYVPADGCCDLLGLDQVGLAQERLCLAEAPATATSG